jgi:glycerol-3-phosphate acyltransferase PlsY
MLLKRHPNIYLKVGNSHLLRYDLPLYYTGKIMTLEITVAVLTAYLIGSISSAIIVCKMMGLADPRTQGSRNPGATNVLRIGGKKAAAITLLGDSLKGFLPVLVSKWIGLPPDSLAIIALAAFIGHLFPVFFRFEGGKGVATALGCLLALNWPTGLCWIGLWIAIAFVFRYSSLAAILASLCSPFLIWLFTHNIVWVITISIMSLILIIRHHANIRKLIHKEERKF